MSEPATVETAPAAPATPRWWGDYEIPRGLAGRWRLGPLTLWARRLEQEWRFACSEEHGEYPIDRAEVDCPIEPGELPPGATVERLAFQSTDERLRVLPALADRSIVTRPETRFRLAPGERVELHVSLPLWIRLEAVAPERTLLDVPTSRPSDTWFGRSTTEGELAYASRTCARLRPENLEIVPWRAVTRVELDNRAEDEFVFERLNLPVPNLALYAAPSGSLWTQAVTVERGADGKLAHIRIADDPPEDVGAAERVAEPRSNLAGNAFVRAIGALLG